MNEKISTCWAGVPVQAALEEVIESLSRKKLKQMKTKKTKRQ